MISVHPPKKSEILNLLHQICVDTTKEVYVTLLDALACFVHYPSLELSVIQEFRLFHVEQVM
jgi:hypothetical protein